MPDQKKTWKRWMLLQDSPRLLWGEPTNTRKQAWIEAATNCGVEPVRIASWINMAKQYSKAVRVRITLER